MIQSLINYFLYPLKKKGKLKEFFYIYRLFLIFINKLYFIFYLRLDNLIPQKYFNYNILIDIYERKINLIIENSKKFNLKSLNLYIKKADILYKNNYNKINNNPFIFYKKYIQIKLNVLDIKNYQLLKEKYSKIINSLQLESEFNKKNIRFIRAKDIFNTIGLSYITDITLKSAKLGLIPDYQFVCLVHNKFRNKAINDFYINKISKHINFIYDDNLINYYKKYEELFDIHQNEFYNLNNKLYLYTQSVGILVNKLWEKKNKKPLFYLNENEIKMGWNHLNKLGIQNNDWFVCVHVRDKLFKGKEKLRDANLENYFPAFQEVLNAGGWVIRIGDKNFRKLPKLKKIIDYPLSKIKSDFMDIFLATQCRFMIGTSSGMSAISHIANVPIAMTNYRPLSTLYLSSKDLYLPGLLKNKNSELLDFENLFKIENSVGGLDGIYTNLLKLEFIENFPDEIKELVLNMLEKINLKKENNIFLSPNQLRIKNIIKKNNTLMNEDILFDSNIPDYFLEKYNNLL